MAGFEARQGMAWQGPAGQGTPVRRCGRGSVPSAIVFARLHSTGAKRGSPGEPSGHPRSRRCGCAVARRELAAGLGPSRPKARPGGPGQGLAGRGVPGLGKAGDPRPDIPGGGRPSAPWDSHAMPKAMAGRIACAHICSSFKASPFARSAEASYPPGLGKAGDPRPDIPGGGRPSAPWDSHAMCSRKSRCSGRLSLAPIFVRPSMNFALCPVVSGNGNQLPANVGETEAKGRSPLRWDGTGIGRPDHRMRTGLDRRRHIVGQRGRSGNVSAPSVGRPV